MFLSTAAFVSAAGFVARLPGWAGGSSHGKHATKTRLQHLLRWLYNQCHADMCRYAPPTRPLGNTWWASLCQLAALPLQSCEFNERFEPRDGRQAGFNSSTSLEEFFFFSSTPCSRFQALLCLPRYGARWQKGFRLQESSLELHTDDTGTEFLTDRWSMSVQSLGCSFDWWLMVWFK